MKIKIKLDPGAKMPTKAYKRDAGFDLYTPYAFTLWPGYGNQESVDTRVHIQIPEGFCGMVKSKSGLYIRNHITCEGVIDSGYTGSIVVSLDNHTDVPIRFEAGQKIAQLVIIPVPMVILEEVNKLEETERGDNGFGSSGRF